MGAHLYICLTAEEIPNSVETALLKKPIRTHSQVPQTVCESYINRQTPLSMAEVGTLRGC